MRPQLRRSLFGLAVDQVDEFITERLTAFLSESAAIQAAIRQNRLEEQKLRETLRQAEERLEQKRALAARLEIMPMSSELIVSAIKEAANKLTAELNATAEKETSALLHRLQRLNSHCDEIRQDLLRRLDQAEQLAALATDSAPTKEAPGKVLPFRVPDRPEAQMACNTLPNESDRNLLSFLKPKRQDRIPSDEKEQAVWLPGSAETASPQPSADSLQPHTTDTTQVTSGLKERSRSNMMNFLQGKVLGQDLLGSDGKTIAPKGAPITAETAERAQKEGVLPELILHMTWPEETDQ